MWTRPRTRRCSPPGSRREDERWPRVGPRVAATFPVRRWRAGRIIRHVSDRPPLSFSLLDAARILARGADLPAKLALLADEASAAADDAGAIILIHDADVQALSSADGHAHLSVLPEAAPALAEAIRDRRPMWSVAPDAPVMGLVGGSGRQSVVPLVVEDELGSSVEGVLLLATDDAGPTEDVREFVSALADLGAVAIRQARLHNALAERAEYLERLARTDPLTGLADRRTFEQMLELEVARAMRQGSPLAIALFDVDGLTRINEDHGASTGDDVLRHVAATIADKVRLIDTVARIGDDVFGVIAPGDFGGIVARRVQDAVKALEPVGTVQASVSAAVAHHPVDGETGADLLATVSAALEQAQAAGPGTLLGLREQG